MMEKVWAWICHLPKGITYFLGFQFFSFCSLVIPDFGEGLMTAINIGQEEMSVVTDRRLENTKECHRLLDEAKSKWNEASDALDKARDTLVKAKLMAGVYEVVAVCETCGWERRMETDIPFEELQAECHAHCYGCRGVISNWKKV